MLRVTGSHSYLRSNDQTERNASSRLHRRLNKGYLFVMMPGFHGPKFWKISEGIIHRRLLPEALLTSSQKQAGSCEDLRVGSKYGTELPSPRLRTQGLDHRSSCQQWQDQCQKTFSIRKKR